MDTTLAICLIIVIYILYALLVKGILWKLILGCFGWLGMYWYLKTIPAAQAFPFNNDTLTWASIIPTIVILLAMMHTKSK